MTQWLLNRLFEVKNQTEPRFAFQATVNWMRALAILVSSDLFKDENIRDHYKSIERRKINRSADTLAFENMMMAFHSQASLARLVKDTTHQYDVCRSAIVSWYYSTYFTCSAMIAATSGSKQETHTNTAKVWQSDIVNFRLLIPPFSLNLNSLVEKSVDLQMSIYRQSNTYDLSSYPSTSDEAWGALFSYLKGTGDYERLRIERKIKDSREYKKLGVSDFRKKAARKLRDTQLEKNTVNYLNQAFRYRGKANYRDSIFLSYGVDNSEKIKILMQDLEKVSYVFQRMAAHYIAARVEKGSWSEFILDLEKSSRLSLKVNYLAVEI
ncbi:hypothetical protein [Synechococcus elongatus]|uniref:hypothetical protein n=1 Tax=Synechococcus elongatus TaxID=32046 RepID=UPI0030CB8D0B